MKYKVINKPLRYAGVMHEVDSEIKVGDKHVRLFTAMKRIEKAKRKKKEPEVKKPSSYKRKDMKAETTDKTEG